jgi:hypothetical protein
MRSTGLQVQSITIKLQKLNRFRSGAILLLYIIQDTALSKARYFLNICYHSRVQIPTVNVSNSQPTTIFRPCAMMLLTAGN